MSILRLKRGGIQFQAMSKKVWKKLTKSTKLLHKFIIHKSKKLVVMNKPRRKRYTTTTTPLYLFPRRNNLKTKNVHKKYKLPNQMSPIYVDNLFMTSCNPSCSKCTSKLIMQSGERNHEDIHGDSSVESTTSVLGIDERAELFISSFRAELDRSLRKW